MSTDEKNTVKEGPNMTAEAIPTPKKKKTFWQGFLTFLMMGGFMVILIVGVVLAIVISLLLGGGK